MAPVRVMTSNVWRFGPAWRDRQAAILSTLRDVDADVVALETSWGNERIDQIFFRPGPAGRQVTVIAPRLAGAPVDGLDPSDHLAVDCDLSWSTEE
jgi:endonuclease/exonuclease/phosphatase family metal-dependent hydrolase